MGVAIAIQNKIPKGKDPAADFARAVDKIIIARVAAMFNQPFWGRLVPRLAIEDATDAGWCPTAATDGEKLYINRDFVNALPNHNQVLFLIAHEIGHCVLDHFTRRGDRDEWLWNIAGDYNINGMLVKGRVGEPITIVPICYDAKYDGLCTEEIYDELLKNPPPKSMQTLDQHLETEGEGKEENGAPRISKGQAQRIQDDFRQAVLDAAAGAGKQGVPKSIQNMIKEFTEPKISWRELIQQTVQSMVKSDFNWMRPNKKMWSSGIYLPGSDYDQTVDLCVAVDVSGSIDKKMFTNIFSEIKGIMDQFPGFKLKVWSFDTSVSNVRDYDESNRDELVDYPIAHGGGTDFMANWEWMKQENIEPKKLIVITDGYPFGAWGDPYYTDTTWIIHGSDTIEPPFGSWAYYDRKKELRR
jgi:predicted metal-dependent peptidase